jgi:hypothetical protein
MADEAGDAGLDPLDIAVGNRRGHAGGLLGTIALSMRCHNRSLMARVAAMTALPTYLPSLAKSPSVCLPASRLSRRSTSQHLVFTPGIGFAAAIRAVTALRYHAFDRDRVSADDDYEVQYFAQKAGITPQQVSQGAADIMTRLSDLGRPLCARRGSATTGASRALG